VYGPGVEVCVVQVLRSLCAPDVELCVCVVQVLNAIPDQDTFYDVSDALEEQGLEKVIGRYRSRKGVERDLLDQFHLYEASLRHEDGVIDNTAELTGHMDNLRSVLSSDDVKKSQFSLSCCFNTTPCLKKTSHLWLAITLTHMNGF